MKQTEQKNILNCFFRLYVFFVYCMHFAIPMLVNRIFSKNMRATRTAFLDLLVMTYRTTNITLPTQLRSHCVCVVRGPTIWNSLLPDICTINSRLSVRHKLSFREAFSITLRQKNGLPILPAVMHGPFLSVLLLLRTLVFFYVACHM